MPRKQRIEYVGATYHIISRGNYRKDRFVQTGSGAAFGRTIFEAAVRCGWELYAYVIMSNHYHLALRTAKRLRRETTAGNPWIAGHLGMGSSNYVSNLINR